MLMATALQRAAALAQEKISQIFAQMDKRAKSALQSRAYAGVAQLVEQLIRNEKVEGSTPFSGTRHLALTPVNMRVWGLLSSLMW